MQAVEEGNGVEEEVGADLVGLVGGCGVRRGGVGWDGVGGTEHVSCFSKDSSREDMVVVMLMLGL